jgi:hypothetical protein
MKAHSLIFSFVCLGLVFGCSAQKKDKSKTAIIPDNLFTVTYMKKGKMVTEKVEVKDRQMLEIYSKIAPDKIYKADAAKLYDTIYDEKKVPEYIKQCDPDYPAFLLKLEYDAWNRLEKITGLGISGNLQPYFHDIAITENKYDDNGNVTEIRLYGENGKLIPAITEDSPITRKYYNDKNQVIEVRFFDENDKLRDTYSILKYEYAENGKIAETKWYNHKGERQ